MTIESALPVGKRGERIPALDRVLLEEQLALARSAQTVEEFQLAIHGRLQEFTEEGPVQRPGEDGATLEPYGPHTEGIVRKHLEHYAEQLHDLTELDDEDLDLEGALREAGVDHEGGEDTP